MGTIVTDPGTIARLMRSPRPVGRGRRPSPDTQALLAGEVLAFPGEMPNHRWYGMARKRGLILRTHRDGGVLYVWMEPQ